MVDAGALEGVSVELLDGLLVDASPQGEQHARVVQALMAVLSGQPRLLRIQMPLAVAEGWIPEPDVALAERHADPARHPATAMLAVASRRLLSGRGSREGTRLCARVGAALLADRRPGRHGQRVHAAHRGRLRVGRRARGL